MERIPPPWMKPPEPEKKPDAAPTEPKPAVPATKEGEKPPEPKPADPPIAPPAPEDPLAKLDLLDRVALRMNASLDREFGGYTGNLGGPKEPTPGLLELALLHSVRGEKPEERASSLAACKLTLNAMLRGGIYDRLDGGFHRQALDRSWTVPCFEKLLEPNAEMLIALVHAWQATQDPVFAQAARQTAGWMRSALFDPELGVFITGQCADAFGGDDGGYFTWTIKELEQAIPDDQHAKLMADFLGIGEWGELSETAPHRNVLHEDRGLAELQARWKDKFAADKIEGLLQDGIKKMLAARRARTAPRVERTGTVEGNARAISALLLYAATFQDNPTRDHAIKVLDRVLVWGVHPKLGAAHALMRGAAAGELTAGFIGWSVNDAALAWACEEAYLSTGETKYLDDAKERLEFIAKFALDSSDGFCWDRFELKNEKDRKEGDPTWPPLLGRLTARQKPLFDLHAPCVSTQYYQSLYRFYALSGKAKKIENCALLKTLEQNETLELLAGLAPATIQLRDMIKNGVAVIAIEGPDDDPKTQELWAEAMHVYLPQTWVMRVRPGQNKALEILGSKADDAGTTPRARIWAEDRKSAVIHDAESLRRALEKL
jgi:uncharacterized protein YyaL (SSP411 family)